MRHIALGVATICMGAMPLCGQAQSSVQIYGKIDLGLRYTDHAGPGGGSVLEEKASTNRLGFRGKERLGDGLSAIFELENGFNGNTGQAGQSGRLFGRHAWVGLRSDTLGTVRLGRQWGPATDYVSKVAAGFQPYGGSIAAHFGDMDNMNGYFRYNNSVKYTSPDFGGFSFAGLYGLGEAGASGNHAFSLAAGYKSGPLVLAASYFQVNDPIRTVYDGDPDKNNIKGTFGSSPLAGLQWADKLKVSAAGGSYQFGPLKLGLLFTDTRLVQSFLAKGDADYQNYEINAAYKVTPTLLVGGAYIYTSGHWHADDHKPKYHQFNLGTSYSFSKRTSVYLKFAYQKAAGDAQFAQINLLPASYRSSQSVTNIGLKHLF